MLTETSDETQVSRPAEGFLKRVLRIEWLGQTAASLFWIASVFTYGITATGDWLQLFAASAWLVANVAALGTSASSEETSNPKRSVNP